MTRKTIISFYYTQTNFFSIEVLIIIIFIVHRVLIFISFIMSVTHSQNIDTLAVLFWTKQPSVSVKKHSKKKKKEITSRCFPRQTTHTYKCLFLICSDISCSTFTQVSSGWNSPDWPKYNAVYRVLPIFSLLSLLHTWKLKWNYLKEIRYF